jgi:hypothetical protein
MTRRKAVTIFGEAVEIVGAEADPYGGVLNWYVRYEGEQEIRTVPRTWIKEVTA